MYGLLTSHLNMSYEWNVLALDVLSLPYLYVIIIKSFCYEKLLYEEKKNGDGTPRVTCNDYLNAFVCGYS